MYCPRCGQQQVSDEMKFCSRCGLPLSGLTEWMSVGGLPAVRQQETQLTTRSARQKGIRRAAKVVFFSGVLFLIFLMIGLITEEGAVMIFPVLTLLVGLTMMLYARLFSDPFPVIKGNKTQGYDLRGTPVAQTLPPATNTPIYGAGNLSDQKVRTNELAQPASVTEHTTKLLDQE